MEKSAGHKIKPEPKRRYTWPWFLLGALVVAFLLALLWMSKEIARVRQIRDLNAPVPQAASEKKDSDDSSWTNGMAWIPPGTFWMGSEDGQADEKPVHQVS